MPLGYCWRVSCACSPPGIPSGSPLELPRRNPRHPRVPGLGAGQLPQPKAAPALPRDSELSASHLCSGASEPSQLTLGSSGIPWGHPKPLRSPGLGTCSEEELRELGRIKAGRGQGRGKLQHSGLALWPRFCLFFLFINFLLVVSPSGTDGFCCLDLQVKLSPWVLLQLRLPN